MLAILFEDNHLIAINKRAGVLVQVDSTGDKSLEDLLKEYLKKKYKKPGAVFLHAVHRIDRPVSGVVLFAKTSKALERMNKLIRDQELKKIYWAVVKNKPAQMSGRLVHFIKRDTGINISALSDRELPGYKKAELDYTIVLHDQGHYFLEIKLITGRHHQVRAQLSAIGCPIIGDVKYGYPKANEDGSIHLHARKAEFIHPVKKELMIIEAAPPKDTIWEAVRSGIQGTEDEENKRTEEQENKRTKE
jgi:23S rRNA pseudouridine1911/1915/1917 synthase